MNNIWIMTRLELFSLYGVNKFIHTKNKKDKNRYLLLSLVWVFLIGIICFYVGGLVYGLSKIGISEIIPAYLVVLTSALIFVFNILKAGNTIFSIKGYDILAAMPVKAGVIAASRFLAMYIENLIISLVVMIPGVVVFGVCENPNISFYFITIVCGLFIPAIPLVISTLLGTLVMAITSRMKNKSIMQSVFMVLFIVVIFVVSYGMQGTESELKEDKILETLGEAGKIIGNIYPQAIWFNNAVLNRNIIELLMFVGGSAALILLTVFVVSKNFDKIIRSLQHFAAKHNYKMKKLEKNSMLKALYIREIKRYFSSSVYVTNTIIGPIMGLIISIAICVMGIDTIEKQIPFNVDISGFVPFALSAVFCIMTTTAVSISMEGKQFWIIKSLPISTKVLLDSKILMNLSLIAPFYILSEIFVIIAVKPDILELVWIVLIPMIIILFTLVFGITVNLKFHSFDWEKEEVVVKQSFSSMVGGFAGFFLSVIAAAIIFLIPLQYQNIGKIAVLLVIGIVTFIMYRKNSVFVFHDFI